MTLNQLIGIGLRHPHYKQVLEELPSIGWFEVHSENFFQESSPALDILYKIRQHYPISIHGVGLSLGSADGLQEKHLLHLKKLTKHVDPFLVSEHLSWGYINGVYIPDLLPLPYTKESFKIFCQNIDMAQDFLSREILIENPSSYIEYKATDQEEAAFLVDLCKQTGAKILLDINNVFVSSSNHSWDAKKYIDSIPNDMVKEIHLAGHSTKTIAKDQILRIDTHDHHVCPEVWELYNYAMRKFGPLHTLLEWDAKIPSLETLIKEANKSLDYLPVDRGMNAKS